MKQIRSKTVQNNLMGTVLVQHNYTTHSHMMSYKASLSLYQHTITLQLGQIWQIILRFWKLRPNGNSIANIGNISGKKGKIQNMTCAHYNFAFL